MNIDSTSCPLNLFEPAFAIVGLSGTLTWSTGTTSSTSVSVSAGAGTLGQVSAITTTFTDLGETIPNGGGLLGLYQSGQKHPTNICFTFNAVFVALIPVGLQVTCRYQLCYPINSVLPTGTVVGGAGTVNWTGSLGAGTLTAV